MFQPSVGYARSSDGVAIAYATVGDGPVPIILVSPVLGQLEIGWEEPAFEAFVSRLAIGARVVLFDRRGSGLSDSAQGSRSTVEELSLARLADDVAAVLDAADVERSVVVGASLGASTAVQFAADNPERTSALVIIGTSCRMTTAPDFDIGMDPSLVDEWIEAAISRWGAGASVEAGGPSTAGDERYRAWAARLERHTSSPGGFEATMRAAFTYDIRPQLERITMPTLVLHRRDDQVVSVEHSRYIAGRIARAEYIELDGVEHTYFLGDQRALLEAIRRFVDRIVAGGALAAAVKQAERSSNYGQGWDALTPREREVAALVAQGLTNAQVAQRVGSSPFTVDGRLRRVFAKLNVSTRVELTAEYARLGAQRDDRR